MPALAELFPSTVQEASRGELMQLCCNTRLQTRHDLSTQRPKLSPREKVMTPERSDITQWLWYPTKRRGKTQSQLCFPTIWGHEAQWVKASPVHGCKPHCPALVSPLKQVAEFGYDHFGLTLLPLTLTSIPDMGRRGLSLRGGLQNETHFR